ncbi:hypothetical protein CFAM422_010105 [Trichoderma lentiforme]|uniref:Major facilitator superfamily (MFS) profile domain-containing protein n=1 Tax=Trichoderma lentiforme TaxID=1567552 RepID=A0A9P5CAW5_9HYPO|nr:hypothetical protein CFAM422_010105 [Trichoderma lentiforme]
MAHGAILVRQGHSDNEPEDADSRSTWQIVGIMVALCMSVFLAALDQTIVSTALPVIAEDLNSASGYTWIGSAYLLGNAAATPTWGGAAEAWGRRPVLFAAVILFFISSLVSALSPNIGCLIAGRAIQGIAGGGLIALPNICVSDLFSVRKRGTYYAAFGVLWAISCAAGPVIGGALAEKVSWRWCFYINLPCSGLALVLLIFLLDIQSPPVRFKAGSLAVSGSTVMILMGLNFGGVTQPWDSVMVVCLIVFGVVICALFVIFEWRHAKRPLVPLQILQNRSNVASLLVCFTHGMVFISGVYFLPLYFQAVLGATPILSGVYILPYAVTFSIVAGMAGGIIQHSNRTAPSILIGVCIMILGFGLYTDFDVGSSWAKIILYQIVAGIGVGPNFQAPLISLQSLTVTEQLATATATYSFIKTVATAVSIAVGGVIFQNRMENKIGSMMNKLSETTIARFSGANAMASIGEVRSLDPIERVLVREAFSSSLKTVWIFYTAVAGAALVISVFVSWCTLDEAQGEVEKWENEKKKQSSKPSGNER